MSAGPPLAPTPSLSALAEQIRALGDADIEALIALLPGQPEAGSKSEPPPPLPATDGALHAAINDTFLPEELPAVETEREAIIACSQRVSVDGTPRLRLTNQARGELLDRVRDSTRYLELLREAVDADGDPTQFTEIAKDPVRLHSAWLRSFLIGEFGDIEQAPATELRAALEALDRLSCVTLPPHVPERSNVRRALQQAELLEPLRVLIGASGGWEGYPYSDRFVGRHSEIRTLRAFVDVLASESYLEGFGRSVSRGIKGASDVLGFARASALVIEAQGGLGKSALIAKFVIDHARGRVDVPFPFAYLDFDSATVQPREPLLLLAEIIRQVGLQFPDSAGSLDDVRQGVLSARQGGRQPNLNPYQEFRRALTSGAAAGRSFLLVLDTMEVAQYDQAAMGSINAFLAELVGSEGFPELRIVIAGRAGAAELTCFKKLKIKPQRLDLKPLSVADAREMAERVGRSLLPADWSSEWSRRIVGKPDDLSDRREPLSIRVAVDALVLSEPGKREALSLEMEKMGEDAHSSFVGRLYERRVLHHVRDKEAQKLAWPGLVVRNITMDIVREVLAGQCGVEPAAAEAVFDALSREVWIVENRLEEGVKVLRHRRELRARTLPLMRRHDRKKFDKINAAAIAYFRSSAAQEPSSRAEWLYHRLLAGEPPERVDRDWDDGLALRLKDAVRDFGDKDPARKYLEARTATKALRPGAILSLPTWLAFEHIAKAAPSYGRFHDLQQVSVVLELSSRGAPERPLSPPAAAVRATLLVKAGRWKEPVPPCHFGSEWDLWSRFARIYRQARDPRSETRPASPSTAAEGPESTDYRLLIQEMVFARVSRSSNYRELDETLADTLEAHPHGGLDTATLRSAAVFGDQASLPAVSLLARSISADSFETVSVSGAELRELARPQGALIVENAERADGEVIRRWIKVADSRGDVPLRVQDQELITALQRAWAAFERHPVPGVAGFMRRYFSLRSADWIGPLAYAAARAARTLSARDVAELTNRLNSYNPPQSWLQRLPMRSTGQPAWLAGNGSDFIELMRTADEAVDLPGMTALILSLVRKNAAGSDLADLAAAHTRWRKVIKQVIAAPPETSPSMPPAPPPGPKNDPQKGRWGGRPERDGRAAQISVTSILQSYFVFDVLVTSTDGSSLEGPVAFHLHPTYPRSIIKVRRVQKGRTVGLFGVTSYGVYAIGVQVRTANGAWTSLEIDLARQEGLPARFLEL